jgi:hypothetical protein
MGWGQVYWLALGSSIGGCDFYIRRAADAEVRMKFYQTLQAGVCTMG